MLLFEIIIIVLVSCTIIQLNCKFTHKYWFIDMITALFAIFSIVLFIVCLFLIPYNDVVNNDMAKYNHYLELYNTGKNNDVIQEEINKINNKIISSRSYKDNIWVGIFYSEDIANLKLIK